MATKRTQVSDLQTNKLQPQSTAVDTYVRPSAPIEDRNTENLLDALGFFNQNLQRTAANMRQDRQKRDQEAVQRDKNALLQASPEERRKIAETGMINGVPIKDLALKKMAGSTEGEPWSDGIRQEFAARNLHGVDVEAEIRQRAADRIKAIGDDPFVLGGFLPHVESTVQWAKGVQAQQGATERKQLEEGVTFQYLSNQVDGWVKSGASPEDMQRGMQSFYSTIAAGKSAIVDPNLLDQYRVQKAQLLVDTNPETAAAILGQEITGPDGQIRQPLAVSPQYAGQVANILKQGQAVIGRREVATGFAQRRQENFARIVRDGDYSAFQDLQIRSEKLAATEQKVQFVWDLTETLDSQVRAGTMTEAQKRREVARYTSLMNVDDPFIKGELEVSGGP